MKSGATKPTRTGGLHVPAGAAKPKCGGLVQGAQGGPVCVWRGFWRRLLIGPGIRGGVGLIHPEGGDRCARWGYQCRGQSSGG